MVTSSDSGSFSCKVVITGISVVLLIVISFVSGVVLDVGLVNSNAPAVAMVRRPATYQAFNVVGVKEKKFLQASFEEMLFHNPDEGSTRKLLKLSL